MFWMINACICMFLLFIKYQISNMNIFQRYMWVPLFLSNFIILLNHCHTRPCYLFHYLFFDRHASSRDGFVLWLSSITSFIDTFSTSSYSGKDEKSIKVFYYPFSPSEQAFHLPFSNFLKWVAFWIFLTGSIWALRIKHMRSLEESPSVFNAISLTSASVKVMLSFWNCPLSISSLWF